TCLSPRPRGCSGSPAEPPSPCCSALARAFDEPTARRAEMTDERMDRLARRLDATSHPDPEFARSTYAALLPRARAARAKDATWIGRVLRDLRLTSVDARRSSAA